LYAPLAALFALSDIPVFADAMDLRMLGPDLWILLAFFLAFMLLAYVCLLIRTKR
jgi:hypothetical protein